MRDWTCIREDTHQGQMPLWAVLERRLIDTMNATPELVLEKYAQPNGYLLWPGSPDFQSIDGLDDMYESFHNWPLFYILGGDRKFLTLSHREYDAITEQFTHYQCGHGHPMVVKEYEQGYDWMHQGEGYLFFYLLNLADPRNEKSVERAKRYAGFYLNEDSDAVNYDPEHRMYRCCYLGSKGAAHRNFDDTPWTWAPWKQWYGLPFHDLPGIETIEDMRDEDKARRMAVAMRERLAYSDTIINLLSTTMIMNAYLHTGDAKYARHIAEYLGAWRERAAQNGGLVPDNVGRDGRIGSEMGGKWYGGYYGWTWPHGFYFIADALTVACENAALLARDAAQMDFVRGHYDAMLQKAVHLDGLPYVPQKYAEPTAVQEYAVYSDKFLRETDAGQARCPEHVRLLQKDGWFEFMLLPQSQPAHLWFVTQNRRDRELIWKTKPPARDAWWERPNDFQSKYQGGQDAAWFEYLHGERPDYPAQILEFNLRQTYGRMKKIAEDTQPIESYSDAYLQARNPITVEGLVHLTMGGPMPIYNGGLLLVSLMYFDIEEKRPGLPADVAALVSHIDGDSLTLTLCNVHPARPRALLVQGGAFGEHVFTHALHNGERVEIGDHCFRVELCAGAVLTLRLEMKRFANAPAYRWPFEAEE